MFIVDTNVLVYAANSRSPFHGPCRALLDAWRRDADAWYSTWSIQYEFLRVVTHPRTLARPWTLEQGWSFLESVRMAPGFSTLVATERHHEVATKTIEETPGIRGNLVHDAHIAILMREHGVRTIYTRDTAFHRFSFLEVIDPLSEVHDRRARRARSRAR